MRMLRLCLNWKVLSALGMAGVGIWMVAPGAILAALPILLFAACPLSMVLMVWGMRQGNQDSTYALQPSLPAALTAEARLAMLNAQREAASRQIAAIGQRLQARQQGVVSAAGQEVKISS